MNLTIKSNLTKQPCVCCGRYFTYDQLELVCENCLEIYRNKKEVINGNFSKTS